MFIVFYYLVNSSNLLSFYLLILSVKTLFERCSLLQRFVAATPPHIAIFPAQICVLVCRQIRCARKVGIFPGCVAGLHCAC
jgi:hypothetical protein